MDQRPLVKVPELAARANCSERHLYTMIERGEVPVVRLGRLVRIRPEVADDFLLKGAGTPAEASAA